MRAGSVPPVAGGTCGGNLAGNVFTTNAVLTDCTVIANFAANIVTHTVTPSVGTSSGTISPSSPQTVNDGTTAAFTLTAASGFHIDNVGGTCGGGLAGNVFTTNAVTTDCTVIANFAANIVTHTVTPSVGTPSGTIAPSTPQTVNDGTTAAFTLTAASGFHIDNVGGTCGGGLAGNVFTTNAVTADCTVIANFAANIVTHTVTPSVATPSGTIAPSTPQTVNDGTTAAFTLAPAGGFHIDNVGGTCGGSLAGNVFTTNAVTTDCTVIANFAADIPPACDGGTDEIFCDGFDGQGGPPVIAAGWVDRSSGTYYIAYAPPAYQWAPMYQGSHRFAAPVN